jgi:hypothetical protein
MESHKIPWFQTTNQIFSLTIINPLLFAHYLGLLFQTTNQTPFVRAPRLQGNNVSSGLQLTTCDVLQIQDWPLHGVLNSSNEAW